jgi:hypothetical protein
MRTPNFFIIGAPKCGTTSLAAWLSEHPEIFMSEVKEPHFFNTDHIEHFRPTAREYDALFADADERHTAVGEASVFYLTSNVAVPAILEREPSAKFIVCVRNPVRMALSLHKQRVFSGSEDITDFAEAWRAQADRTRGLRPPPLNEPSRSLYGNMCSLGRQLEQLLQIVDRGQVHIVFLDDLRRQPATTYRDVLRFLGVAEDHAPAFEQRNPAQERRYPWLRRAAVKAGLIKRKLGFRRGLGILESLNRWNARDSRWAATPAMMAELKAYFREDIEQLAAITGRDLSAWLDDRSDAPTPAGARGGGVLVDQDSPDR